MHKLDSLTQAVSFVVDSASHSDHHPVDRLVVLVPVDADSTPATHRVWELANAIGARIQFLGLCKDPAYEPSLRRQLVTMSALVADQRISAEAKVEIGTNWVTAVKTNLQEGDLIVCFAEQRAGLFHRPLSQILESNLNTTVYVLSGFQPPERPRSNWSVSLMMWAGFIGIIAFFFWAQVKLTQLPDDWAHTLLLYLSLFAEVGLIGVWNSLF